MRLRLLLREALIYGFHKHIFGPEPRFGTVSGVIILGQTGRFHLFQRHSFFDRGLDAIANNGNHVAELEQFGLVAHAAVAPE